MKKLAFSLLAAMLWIGAYSDWLQPGYLNFGVPAAWDKPLSTSTSYDLAEGVKNTAKCTTLELIPDWAKPGNWRLPGSTRTEPKSCKQKLKEKEDD